MPKMVPVIVIVEDDKTLLDMYTEVLDKEGFIVVGVQRGDEALTVITRENPDLVLLDIMLPGESELDILQVLRSNPNTNNLPVVIMTAHPEDKFKNMAQRYGVNDFISKSEVKPSEIIDKIKVLLKI